MNKTEELLLVIQSISRKLRSLKEEEIKNIDLNDFSFSYFRYIEAIHKLKNPTFLDLATELKLSKPTVTIMVNNLIEKGYVTKQKSSSDKRFYNLALTEVSKKIIQSHSKMFREFTKGIAARFTDEEIESLIYLLKKI